MPKKKTKTETFTSGPWLSQEENGGFIEIVDKADRLLVQIISDGPAAKKSAGWVPAAEAEANKRLVLASPRLYRVLENLTARIGAMRSALQKKGIEFPLRWLDDGILADAQAVLTEAAPRIRPVPVSRRPVKKA